mmetsp:Transcript_13137/g.9520  ORF Transcript_13137/g.9520 Transcript_13137/m.9520 type:complete len:93 (+) Transcript_13137:176-454(+)
MVNISTYRRENLFEIFGVGRHSSEEEIKLRKEYWIERLESGEFNPIWAEEFEDMFNMVQDPELREMYDKHEFYIKLEAISKGGSMPMTVKYL